MAWEQSSAFPQLTIGAARLYNIGSQVMFPILAFTGHSRFLRALHWVWSDIPVTVHSLWRKSQAVADTTQTRAMIAKTRKRRGKKPGPKPLPRGLKRKRITIILTPRYHRQVTAHKSPGIFVERCISLARCITRDQHSRLVEIRLASGKTVDKLVHEVKGI